MRVRNRVLVALVGTVRPVLAQKPAAGAKPGARADTLQCFSCNPRKRPLRAFGELMIAQLIPFSFNAVIRDKPWAKVSLQSWEENLENPWQWDNDHFITTSSATPTTAICTSIAPGTTATASGVRCRGPTGAVS